MLIKPIEIYKGGMMIDYTGRMIHLDVTGYDVDVLADLFSKVKENGIKHYLDSVYLKGWDTRALEIKLEVVKQYILSKNKTEDISDTKAHYLAAILMRKHTSVNFIFFSSLINWLTEEELNNIITEIDLSEDGSLSEQLRFYCAEYFGIKGKKRALEFFKWADQFIHDTHGFNTMMELKFNPRPIKLDAPWQFLNLIYDLKIGPELGNRLSHKELVILSGLTYLDCSYLEDYDFPEPFHINLEMYIKAGGAHKDIKGGVGQLLLGLTEKEYLGFWHAKLKTVPLVHYTARRVSPLLREYLMEKII